MAVGLGVAIPRFISMAMTLAALKNVHSYYFASLYILIFPLLIFFAASIVLPGQMAYLFFGDEKFGYLILPVSCMLTGLSMHTLVYGYYRGTFQMSKANITQLINLGIVPLVVFYLGQTPVQILMITALLWISISAFFMFAQLTKIRFDKTDSRKAIKELLVFGLPRVPGDFLLLLFLNLPIIMVNHSYGVITGSYIIISMTFLRMAGAMFAPICLMLLTDISQLLVKNDFVQIKQRTNLILKVTVGLTLLGIVMVELICPFVINDLLKIEGPVPVESTRVIILAAMGYTVYISLRSVLDAYYIKPVNTINIAISVAIFACAVSFYRYLDLGYMYILGCFIGAMSILGLLTWIETRKIMKRNNV